MTEPVVSSRSTSHARRRFVTMAETACSTSAWPKSRMNEFPVPSGKKPSVARALGLLLAAGASASPRPFRISYAVPSPPTAMN
jgi:hypothetical protein